MIWEVQQLFHAFEVTLHHFYIARYPTRPEIIDLPRRKWGARLDVTNRVAPLDDDAQFVVISWQLAMVQALELLAAPVVNSSRPKRVVYRSVRRVRNSRGNQALEAIIQQTGSNVTALRLLTYQPRVVQQQFAIAHLSSDVCGSICGGDV